jgi:Flp pilus assembly protein TadG
MRRFFRGIIWGSDRGAAAVEFALVFPVLVLVLVGIVEYGSIFNTQLMLTSAAREGARTMAVTGDAAQARTAVVDAALGLGPALTSADIVVTPTSCSATTNVSVTIDYAKPYLTGLFGATIALEGKSTRKCFG